MTGIDTDGFDLACGDRIGRVFFAEPVLEPADMRKFLVAMAGEARHALTPDDAKITNRQTG